MTLIVNARAGRKQSERHWKREASSVRIALSGEIIQLKAAMSNQREYLQETEDGDEGSFLVPSRRIDVVFHALVPQLGALEPLQVEAVMNVYGQYAVYLEKLQIISSSHLYGQYMLVSNQWRSVVAAHCGYVIDKADNALKLLQGQ